MELFTFLECGNDKKLFTLLYVLVIRLLLSRCMLCIFVVKQVAIAPMQNTKLCKLVVGGW